MPFFQRLQLGVGRLARVDAHLLGDGRTVILGGFVWRVGSRCRLRQGRFGDRDDQFPLNPPFIAPVVPLGDPDQDLRKSRLHDQDRCTDGVQLDPALLGRQRGFQVTMDRNGRRQIGAVTRQLQDVAAAEAKADRGAAVID